MVGGSLQQIIKQQQLGDIANLRARYSMGGTGAGTPGAYAESMYRSQAAPQAAMQIGNLQLQAMQPLLQSMFGLTQRGTPQATSMVSASPFMQVMNMLPGLGMGAGGLMRGIASLRGGGAGGGAGDQALPDDLTLGGGGNIDSGGGAGGIDPSTIMQMLPLLAGMGIL